MIGQDWPVGTIATATVLGVAGVRIMRVEGGWADKRNLLSPKSVTDVRPLVVLDPETLTSREERVGVSAEAEIVVCLRKLADEDFGTYRARVARRLADQIDAQTKPPRIPEPGLWGVVEASVRQYQERYRFGRTKRDTWVKEETGGGFDWAELVNPVLVRPGIEEES